MMYYVFPDGIYDEDGSGLLGKYYVYRWRSMPCTPAGDEVGEFDTKQQAAEFARQANDDDLTLAEAKVRYERCSVPKSSEKTSESPAR